MEVFLQQYGSAEPNILWPMWPQMGSGQQGSTTKGNKTQTRRNKCHCRCCFSGAFRWLWFFTIVFCQFRSVCTEHIRSGSSAEEFQNSAPPASKPFRKSREPNCQTDSCTSGNRSHVASFCTEDPRKGASGASESVGFPCQSQCRAWSFATRAPGFDSRPATIWRAGTPHAWTNGTTSICIPSCAWSPSSSKQSSLQWSSCSSCWNTCVREHGSRPGLFFPWARLSASQHYRSSLEFCCTNCTSCTCSSHDATCCRFGLCACYDADAASCPGSSHDSRDKSWYPETGLSTSRELERPDRNVSQSIVSSCQLTASGDREPDSSACTATGTDPCSTRCGSSQDCARRSGSHDIFASCSGRHKWTGIDRTATCPACSICITASPMPTQDCRVEAASTISFAQQQHCNSACISHTRYPCRDSRIAHCARHHVNQQLTSQTWAASREIQHVTKGTKIAEDSQDTAWISACRSWTHDPCTAISHHFFCGSSAYRNCRNRSRGGFFGSRWATPRLGVARQHADQIQGSIYCESFATSQCSFDQKPSQPQVLLLDQHLVWNSREQHLFESQQLFQQLSQPWPDTALLWTLDFMDFLPDLSQATASILRTCQVWRSCPVTAIHIYVDGSSFGSNRPDQAGQAAGWAFIVLTECQSNDNDKFQFLCASGGPLSPACSNSYEHVDVGELLYDSTSAEAVAMIWTLSWISQMSFRVPAHIHYDNQTIGQFTAGVASWTASWEYAKLHARLGSLRQCLQAKGQILEFEHQKSHCNHPWSDLVDATAKAAAKNVVFPLDQPSHVSQVLRHPAFCFAWISLLSSEHVPTSAGLHGTFKAEGPFGHQELDIHWQHDPGHNTDEIATLTLRFVTANVLTLHTGPKNRQLCGLLERGRIANLQAQFAQQKCSLIGLQECRTHDQRVRHSSSHFVFQSGASSDGARGCELWVDRHLPYAVSANQRYFFQEKHFTVALFSDRLLLVVIKAPHLKLRLLIAHAPHEAATDVSLESWWQQLTHHLSRICPHLPIVVLGDLNSRLGSVQSEAVSSLNREEENVAGHYLHSFLLEQGLWAPSTFDEYHSGSSITWISSHGQAHRLDYVLLPQAWQSFQVSSQACDVDLIVSREDHFPVLADVSMRVARSTVRTPHRTKLDRTKLQDPDAVTGFREYLQHPPDIPWTTGVGHHVDELTMWLQQGATTFFAPSKSKPRQRYMSENTWQLVQVRKKLLRIAHQAFDQAARSSLRLWFHAWISVVPQLSCQLGFLPYIAFRTTIHGLIRFAFWTLHIRAKFHPIARHASRHDRIQCATQLVDSFYNAARGHDTRAMYRALRPLLGQADRKTLNMFKPLPAVTLQDGTLASTAEIAQERWRDHFAGPEQGIAVTCAQLQELAQIQFQTYPPGSFELDVQSIPTLTEVEQYIRKAKKHKSPGCDGLFAEIFQIDVPTVSRHLWPLLTKCTVRCCEPLQWKGGEVFSLPKTSKASFNVDHYRSILLADFTSKIRHGLVRSKLLPSFLAYKDSMQAGGVPKLCTDFLTLHVQAYASWTKSQGLSSAFFFVDIKQAFYRTCRSLVTHRHISDTQLVQLFQSNQWSPDMLQEFRARLREPDALQQAHVSQHMQAQVSDLLTSTWFQMRGEGSTLTHTAAGTRPGDSVADLLYAFVMTRFIRVVHERFIQAGLHTEYLLHWVPACRFQPDEIAPVSVVHACWVDDLVLMFCSAKPSTLVQKLQCAAQIVQDAAVEFALQLNYSRDKTSVLLAFHGPQARAQWSSLMPSDGKPMTIAFQCKSKDTPIELHVVPDYIYLGTLIDTTGHPAAEVRRRFLAVQPMKRMLQKGIFKSPKLPTPTRHLIFRSLVISRLMYGSGAWHSFNVLTLRSFCTQLIQLYRFLTPHLVPQAGVTRLDLVAHSAQPHPLLLLASQRMSLFDRLAQVDMSELFAVLQNQPSDSSWYHSVLTDISFLLRTVPDDHIASLLQDSAPFSLAQHSFQVPMVFTKFCKKVCKTFQAYCQLWKTFRHFQQKFDQACSTAGVTWEYAASPLQPTDGFVCEECSATFDSFKALCTHTFKKHRQYSLAQYYTASNQCRACLKTYDQRKQVIHHLKYVKTHCLTKLVCLYAPLSDEEVQEAQQRDALSCPQTKKQQRKQRHVWPVVRAHGPLQPWPWERHLAFIRQDTRDLDFDSSEIHAWLASVFQAADQSDVPATYDILNTRPYHGRLASMVTSFFDAYVSEQTSEHIATAHLTLQEAICLWQDCDLGLPPNPCFPVHSQIAQISLHQVRIPSQPQEVPTVPLQVKRDSHVATLWNEFCVAEQLRIQTLKEHSKRYLFPEVPRVVLSFNPICLYIFSGRRREGDFQSFFEQEVYRVRIRARVLLLDLALDDSHDVANEVLVQQILSWIHDGAVCGILLAPPCETWSQARFRRERTCDPRPLRSASSPLALPGLRLPELEQLNVSNLLLFVALRILLAAVLSQVAAILEHPAEPHRPDRPTIWKLPWMRVLLEHTALKRCLLLQAHYGGIAVKPAHMVYCYADHFEAFLAAAKQPFDRSQLQVLSGRDEHGHWKTAKAKEYPRDLNRVLACTLVHACKQRFDNGEGEAPLPPHIDQGYAALDHGQDDWQAQSMRPDFGGHHRSIGSLDILDWKRAPHSHF